MAKTYVNTVKYIIHIDFEIKGVVDKPDVIGAVFGQSEGLLGDDMDLRELQKSGRIGRIEIFPKTHLGVTRGNMTIPSSMDMVETSILAAAIESVDKTGPCESKFIVKGVEDTRTIKRREVAKRAEGILRNLMNTALPEVQGIAEQVRANVRSAEVRVFGPEKVACGPGIFESDSIILVEGRADVVTLLKNGIKNVISMGGSKIPQSVADLCRKKTVTVFVDGDRGGLLNIRKLQQLTEIDFVARAPDGKEVEELMQKEINMSLRRKIPAAQFTGKTEDFNDKALNAATGTVPHSGPTQAPSAPVNASIARPVLRASVSSPGTVGVRVVSSRTAVPVSSRATSVRSSGMGTAAASPAFARPTVAVRPLQVVSPVETVSEEDKGLFQPMIKTLKGTLKAKLLGKSNKELVEIPVRDLLKTLDKKKGVEAIVFDGIITKRVVDEAVKHKVKIVVGIKKGSFTADPSVKTIVLSTV